MEGAVMRFNRVNIPKLPDAALSITLFGYFCWPFWAKHGGPPPPSDLGTVMLAVIGLYGTQKAFNTNKEQDAADKAKEKRDEQDPPVEG